MPSIDYDSTVDVAEWLEERLVESLTAETSVSRLAVLGGFGVAECSSRTREFSGKCLVRPRR
jgi:hypothetical protein